MTMVWTRSGVDRSTPYLDWQWKNRTPDCTDPEGWCPMHIQVVPAADASYLPNLLRLQQAVDDGRMDDDPAGALTIRMAADEFDLLQTLIADIREVRTQRPTVPVDMQFFVYRPETIANRWTSAAINGFYDIIDIGPPIRELGVRRERGARDRTPLARLFTPSGQVGIGIIDGGIAFANKRFRNSLGQTRFQAIWLQDIERPSPDQGVAYGQRLHAADVDKLLASGQSEAEIYRSLGLNDFRRPGRNALASRLSHGTHILDLASGFDPASDAGNVRDLRPLFAVQLPWAVTEDTSGVMMGSYVLQAARQIMLWADMVHPTLPLVINFSYGISAGPKDGTHHIERTLSQMIDRRTERGAPTCLVLPAGNNYRDRATATMQLNMLGGAGSIDWVLLPDDGTPNHLEIWLDGNSVAAALSALELTIAPPAGPPSVFRALGDGEMHLLQSDGRPVAGIYHDVVRPAAGRERVRIHIAVNGTGRGASAHPAPAGRWRIALTNGSSDDVTARLYIQRDNTPIGHPLRGRQSHFDHPEAYDRRPLDGSYRNLNGNCPITTADTLSAIATGAGALVVGAADVSRLPTDYTASGPARSRQGPDCAAITDLSPTHWGVLAAGTYSGSIVTMRGTSVAAPQLVRRVADYLGAVNSGAVAPAGKAPDDDRSPPQLSPSQAALTAIADNRANALNAIDLLRLGSFVLRDKTDQAIPRRTY